VIDVAPSVLEAASLPEPRVVNGVKQRPMRAVSACSTPSTTPGPRAGARPSYLEILGNRAISHDGWLTGTNKAPWEAAPRAPMARDRWELYNARKYAREP
jgi:arylsulfatase A-like enzyme